MNTILLRGLPYALGCTGILFGYLGIMASSIEALAIGCALLLSWAVFELRHPVNPRRTMAARFNVWGMPVCLVLLAILAMR